MKQSFLEISFAAIAFTLAFSIAYATGLDIVKDAVLYAFIIQWVLYIPAYLFQTEKFYDLSGSITYIFVISYILCSTYEPNEINYGNISCPYLFQFGQLDLEVSFL